jgi:hypothetical protein
MDDLIYIGITVAFFILTWGLMKMCEVLSDEKSGGNI